jgi:hypothetical protein
VTVRRALLLAVFTLALAAPARADDVTYSIAGTAGQNGWFVGNVTVSWHVPAGMYPTPESDCLEGDSVTQVTSNTPGKQLLCQVPDVVRIERIIKIDKNAPTSVAAVPARPAGANGWYNAPIPVGWSGQDGLSGVAACTTLTYGGPDTGGSQLAGSCTDRAGNKSADVAFGLKYDATPPDFANLAAKRDGDALTLNWMTSADTAGVTVARQPDAAQARSFAGAAGSLTDTGLADGVKYTYVVTATDVAGNATTRTLDSSRPAGVLAPKTGAKVKKPPVLRWRAAKKADYYNVQIFDGKRKVLSAWPSRARLTLKRRWRFGGVARRLRAGHTYRWFVWPGIGRRSAHKYGRLIGQGTFTMKS